MQPLSRAFLKGFLAGVVLSGQPPLALTHPRITLVVAADRHQRETAMAKEGSKKEEAGESKKKEAHEKKVEALLEKHAKRMEMHEKKMIAHEKKVAHHMKHKAKY